MDKTFIDGERARRSKSGAVSLGDIMTMIDNKSTFGGLAGQELSRNEAGLVEHARRTCSMLGISVDAWHQAVGTMGRIGAAAAIASIDAKGKRVHNPGGYLRGMTSKAAKGELRLARTINYYSRRS